MKEIKTCLFCQTDNEYQLDEQTSQTSQTKKTRSQKCQNCGMELPEKHPNDRRIGVRFFIKAFWLIALFCLVMVFYLPR